MSTRPLGSASAPSQAYSEIIPCFDAALGVAIGDGSGRCGVPIIPTARSPAARGRRVGLRSARNEIFCYLLRKREIKIEFKEFRSRLDACTLQCTAMTA